MHAVLARDPRPPARMMAAMLALVPLLLAPGAASAAAPPTTASLWTSGHGFPCFRQPVVISAGGSRLLAFVEGRFSSPCAPAATSDAEARRPDEVGGLNLRISEDGGSTWGPSKIIYGNAVRRARAQPPAACPVHSA